MRRDVDVLVVGSGPAGLVAATRLAAAGFETLVVERQRSVGEHVRTSGATATRTAHRFGVPPHLYHPVRRLRISSPETTTTFDCGPDGLCILDVRGVYRWLADGAREAGASILVDTTALDPLLSGTSVIGCTLRVGAEVQEVRARVVVDAGGHRAQMSKRAGLHGGFRRFGVGAEYELGAPRADQDEAVIILSSRFAPSGYAWSFPWGEDRVRLGVGVHHTDVRNDPKRLVSSLLEHERVFDLGVPGAEIREYHYGLIPADGLARRFAGDGIVAVGDAAGQATLVVGEGIRVSMIAGEMAAEALGDALRAGRVDRSMLGVYERRFRADFGRSLRIGYRLNKTLSKYDDRTWDDRLEFLRQMPPSLVLELLQAQVNKRELVRWLARHPRQLLRAGPLAGALVPRP